MAFHWFSFAFFFIASSFCIIIPLHVVFCAGFAVFLLLKLTSPRFVLEPEFSLFITWFRLAHTNAVFYTDPFILLDLASFSPFVWSLCLASLWLLCILLASSFNALILHHFSGTDILSFKGHYLCERKITSEKCSVKCFLEIVLNVDGGCDLSQ
jgi:hypothetical protein